MYQVKSLWSVIQIKVPLCHCWHRGLCRHQAGLASRADVTAAPITQLSFNKTVSGADVPSCHGRLLLLSKYRPPVPLLQPPLSPATNPTQPVHPTPPSSLSFNIPATCLRPPQHPPLPPPPSSATAASSPTTSTSAAPPPPPSCDSFPQFSTPLAASPRPSSSPGRSRVLYQSQSASCSLITHREQRCLIV